MDIDVRQAAPDRWVLTDLLGRPAGRIEQQRPGMFRILPSDRTAAVLRAATAQSFETLDQALTAIEACAGGACRLREP